MKKFVIVFSTLLTISFLFQFFANANASQSTYVPEKSMENIQLLLLTQLVYSELDEVQAEMSVGDMLKSDTVSPEAMTDFKTDISKGGLDLDEVIKKAKLEDWILYHVEENNENGFFGAIFINKENGKFVVSFRGTDSFQDISESLVAFKNEEISQVESAKILLENVPNDIKNEDVILIGHSLGGHIAARIGATQNYEAVTFNAFGFKPSSLIELRENGLVRYEENVTNYNIKGDPVSGYGEQIGQSYTLAKEWQWSFMRSHKLYTFYHFVE